MVPAPSQPAICARRVTVTGRVTGIGFRWHTCNKARDFPGLRGYVRNRDRRTVECVVQGETWMVEEMVSWLRHGPSWARVDEMAVTSLPVDPTLDLFHVAR
jgi:acylphosphatase